MPNSIKEKRCNLKRFATLHSHYSILDGQCYFSSPSTSAISRAVAVTIKCALCVQLQPGYLLPGLPEAYHPQTDRRAHEKNAGECDAIGAK